MSFCFVLFEVIPSGIQDLLLTMHSGITPNMFWMTIWSTDDQTQISCMEDNHPLLYTIVLAPNHLYIKQS